MLELFDKFLTIMFSTSFWHFLGCLVLVLVITSIVEFIIEHFLTFFGIIFRGHPPINNYYIKEDKNKEESKKDE
jgi:hypothetical protein